jgi:calcineurin-like phosphoesterase family protein
MKELLTSDMHLGHGNILLYCKRPWLRDGDWYETEKTRPAFCGKVKKRPAWVSAEIKKARTDEMNEALVREWNLVVSPEDTVKHLGDFYFHSNDGKDAVYWEGRLNGKIVHIKGNHDRSRKIKGMMDSATMSVAGHEFLLQHRPPERIEEIPDFCDAVLCGHVHEAWEYKWVGGILVLNVGVDVRNFRPMAVDAVVGEVERLQKNGK